MKKALTQKNTLLKNAQGNAESNFFKRVFFSPTQIKLFLKISNASKKKYKKFQRTVRTLNIIALNVNRFGQSVCGLQTVVLRTDSRAAANIRLKEILKKGALTVKRTVVHLSNSCGYTNSRASNPPFLKLL